MKRNGIKTIVICFGLIVLVVNQSFGQPQDRPDHKKPPTIDELFKMMDENKDEKLSVKEVKGPLKDDFKKIDTNKDGVLSREELEKAPKPKKGDQNENEK